MAQVLHAAKQQAWSERLRRFDRSGLTVAEFCRREGIPAVSFYQWRRKLTSRAAASPRATSRSSFLPVEVVSPVSTGAPVEIHFPNGVQVNLTSTDPKLAAAAIAAAAQVHVVPREQEELAC